jgi:hypothetical protein
MPIAHSTFAAGDRELIVRIVTDYRCGHCTGLVEEVITDDATGILQAAVRHDTGCPVLAGHVPAEPDTGRAAIPATFRS